MGGAGVLSGEDASGCGDKGAPAPPQIRSQNGRELLVGCGRGAIPSMQQFSDTRCCFVKKDIRLHNKWTRCRCHPAVCQGHGSKSPASRRQIRRLKVNLIT